MTKKTSVQFIPVILASTFWQMISVWGGNNTCYQLHALITQHSDNLSFILQTKWLDMMWTQGTSLSLSKLLWSINRQKRSSFRVKSILLNWRALPIWMNNSWKWSEILNLWSSLHSHKFWHIFTKVSNTK